MIEPKIKEFMTPFPHTINVKVNIEHATTLMREHKIRHLPVLNAGKLVGILSDRDTNFALSFKDPQNLTIEDIMVEAPYHVDPNTSVSEVISEMLKYKYGCTIITENNKPIGIFTDTDVLSLANFLLEKISKLE